MNRTALQERIKEEIVIRRGQVKDRQWRQTGLLDEAAREGIPTEEFRRLVNEVSRQVNFEKLTDLRRRLEDTLLAPPPFELHQTQTDEFVAEAERMGLSATFVRERWIPTLIADLKNMPATSPTLTEPPPPSPTPPAPNSTLEPQPFQAPGITDNGAIRERVRTILDEQQGHITARELRLLFRAIPADERVLAEEILAYLSANFYAAETEAKGVTLQEKLLSTDWRHLSWWNKEPESQPAPTPTFVPPVIEPVRATPPPAMPPPMPAPRASNAGLWGAMFAVAVLLILYFLIKPNAKKREQDGGDSVRTEQQDERPARDSETTKRKRERKNRPETSSDTRSEQGQSSENEIADTRPVPAKAPAERTSTPDEKPVVDENRKPAQRYDQILETTGQFGERQARLGHRWGLWRKGDWMILPIYDDITVFNNNRASVALKGKTYEIDEKGNAVEQ